MIWVERNQIQVIDRWSFSHKIRLIYDNNWNFHRLYYFQEDLSDSPKDAKKGYYWKEGNIRMNNLYEWNFSYIYNLLILSMINKIDKINSLIRFEEIRTKESNRLCWTFWQTHTPDSLDLTLWLRDLSKKLFLKICYGSTIFMRNSRKNPLLFFRK